MNKTGQKVVVEINWSLLQTFLHDLETIRLVKKVGLHSICLNKMT